MPERRVRLILAALAGFLVLGFFSPEIVDTDFWWTLKSGQYIAQHHRLPVPDPFAFTTALAHDRYPAESTVRRFNLTFEWLAQLGFYGVYAIAGFPGIVLFRALLLTGFCALCGLCVRLRTGGFYRALAAAIACAWCMQTFTLDRSYLFTFFFLALTITILERRRYLWALPAICLLWANCHGGFFLAWIVLGAYAVDAWRCRAADRAQLWILSAASIAMTGINPNGFAIVTVLPALRSSFLQSKLLEWAPPALWPPTAFSVLLVIAAAAALWARRRLRLADMLLFVAFAYAALTAQRNTFLIAFWAPVMIASYFPAPKLKPAWQKVAAPAVAAALAIALTGGVFRGDFFQLRVASWRFPTGAANFLKAHHITGRLFNTYEYGGYLIWALWPQDQVFIDGRALSESVFHDYVDILYNRDNALALLNQYGAQTIVMNTFEGSQGLLYNIAPALASPNQQEWKPIYNDPQAIIFVRNPPLDVQPLPWDQVFDHIEAECSMHIEHRPDEIACARRLGQVFSRLGATAKARQWLGFYLERIHAPDLEAEAAYGQLSH